MIWFKVLFDMGNGIRCLFDGGFVLILLMFVGVFFDCFYDVYDDFNRNGFSFFLVMVSVNVLFF